MYKSRLHLNGTYSFRTFEVPGRNVPKETLSGVLKHNYQNIRKIIGLEVFGLRRDQTSNTLLYSYSKYLLLSSGKRWGREE